ncbi:MAG: hypothetical protein WBW75_08425 [Mycobacterium sp.]
MAKVMAAALLTAGAVVVSGCYYTTSGRPVPKPTSAITNPATTAIAAPSSSTPPTKPALQPGPHSWIADVDLPEGTVQCTTAFCADFPSKNPFHGTEFWRYSASFDDAVAFLRDRFAAGRQYDAHGATWWKGLPPCYNTAHQSPPWGSTTYDYRHDWLWSDGVRNLVVVVYKPGAPIFKPESGLNPPFGVIETSEGSPGPIEGCYRG